ncbi:methyl-accepting chemotaxis protein [Rhodoferax saidenbachensis]|uniref:Methyl-accepting chemotaxis protein n=1 Tax=Rhodoferax saidenbachensis TaxID=1484693 RepID=A0A1P8K8X5_9BURK|nr:methyl-accepting chemotaxis protein [Rhodoferax saidenbachensis]APW42461.1 methyl-accepting chemotaxis protein [Rhodoferax saidenbachensis]
MTFRNMSIRTRLSLAFGGLAVMVMAVAALALTALADANTRFTSYTSGLNARAGMAAHVRAAVDDRAIAARNLVLVTKEADLAIEKAAVARAHQEVQDSLARLNKMINSGTDVSAQGRKLVAEIDKVEQSYGPLALAIVDLVLNNKREQAITRMNDECRPLLAALIKATNEYEQFTLGRTRDLEQAAIADYALQRNTLAALCLLAVVVAVIAGWLITRSITGPLNQAVEAADRIAAGDLDAAISVNSTDETGRLLGSLQRMQQSLVDTVSTVRGNAESVSLASAQIAQGNNHLSQRTEEQASALQQTAASMEQLGGTVRNNADNARQAGQLAAAASNVALKGGDVVGQVVQTMKGINDSSRQISEIISTIDGIAFQTNILALNAAVEAARAGEQGRGFSVVAAEVRNLAQRSAEAAKEIKTLITASVQRVEQGTTLVDQAGSTMQEIVDSVKRVSDIMGEISAASAEQSTGVGQVGDAVSQMDHATQQNAALVEESAAAATSLQMQAEQLVQAVAVFRFAQQALAVRSESAVPYIGPERRSVDRASNVTRLQPTAKAAAKPLAVTATAGLRTGTHDWETF